MKQKNKLIARYVFTTLSLAVMFYSLNYAAISDKKKMVVSNFQNEVKFIKETELSSDELFYKYGIIKLVYDGDELIDSPKDYPSNYTFEYEIYDQSIINIDRIGPFVYNQYLKNDLNYIFISRVDVRDLKVQNFFYLCSFSFILITLVLCELTFRLHRKKLSSYYDLAKTLDKQEIKNDIENLTPLYDEVKLKINSNHFYERFLSSGSNAVFLFDSEMGMIFFNNKAKKYMISNGRKLTLESDIIKSILGSVIVSEYEEGIIQVEDETYSYEMFSEIIDGEKFYGLYLNDITETVMFKTNQITFFNQASHELRTPLTSISGFIELLTVCEMESERRNGILSLSAEQCKKMDLLITSIIDISKRFRMDDLFTKTSLNKLVDNCLKKYKRFMSIDVRNNIEDNSLLICNNIKVETLLDCIIENAFVHNIFDGFVELTTSSKFGFIIITISNSCEKISQERIDDVFKPFFEKSEVEDEEEIVIKKGKEITGPGLGLSVAKTICETYNYGFVFDYSNELFEISISFFADVVKDRL